MKARRSAEPPSGLTALAGRYHQAGEFAEAAATYRQMLEFAPRHAPTLMMLGLAEQSLGDNAAALTHLQQATQAAPADAVIWHNYGSVLQDLGQHDAARQALKRALALNPKFPPSWNSLGTTEHRQGQTAEAERCYRKALAFNPQSAETWQNLGLLLRDVGRADEAISALRESARLDPQYFDPRAHLGALLLRRGDEEEAQQVLEEADRLQPDVATLARLSAIYRDLAEPERAQACLQRARSLEDSGRIAFRQAMLLPVILPSMAALEDERQAYAERLEHLAERAWQIEDPARDVGETPFLLAYHGRNDVALQQRLSAILRAACPALNRQAPHIADWRGPGPRIRLGVVSAHLWGHSVGKAIVGLLDGLDRERFELRVYPTAPPRDDAVAQAIRARADHYEVLPYGFPATQERLAAEQLDLLFYPEIGMDPTVFYLAFNRLAPVQCTTWGHLDTTGISTVDAWLSNAQAEPDDGDQHYSEQLLRLPGAMFPGYPRPPLPAQPASRAELGLPTAARLYVCPQSLFKLHPAFDRPLLEILRRDTDAQLVLPENRAGWRQLLLQRWSHTVPDIAERVIWMPWQGEAAYRNWIGVCDVMLDPMFYGGGVSTLDGLTAGTPIVTWPGPLMRGRFTLACYRQMGISDLLARDEEHYIELALQVAADRDCNQSLREQIRQRSAALFDDHSAVAAWNQALAELVAARARQ